jgi:phosphate transport system permease protein
MFDGDTPLPQRDLEKRAMKRPGETLIIGLLWVCGLISIATTFAIIITLFTEARPFFSDVSLVEFFGGTRWQALIPGTESFGVWALVAGTANVLLWSMVFALPLGIAAAVYLSEYASPSVRRILKPTLEVLAGVPTVVYAFFALTFITQDVLRPLLGDERVPIFNSLSATCRASYGRRPTGWGRRSWRWRSRSSSRRRFRASSPRCCSGSRG